MVSYSISEIMPDGKGFTVCYGSSLFFALNGLRHELKSGANLCITVDGKKGKAAAKRLNKILKMSVGMPADELRALIRHRILNMRIDEGDMRCPVQYCGE